MFRLTRKNIIKLSLLTLASFGAGQSWGQFYVSPKSCVLDITTGEGGALEGCPNATYFFDTDLDSESWVWDFGDPTNPSQATTRNPQFFYSTAGDYQVSLTKISKAGITSTVSKTVSIGSLPQQPKFNGVTSADTTVCDNSALTLNPFKLAVGTSNYSYLWYPGGDTTKTIDVDSSGCYSVEVFGPDGCSRTAKINVKFCYEEAGGGGGNEEWFFGKGATLEFQSDGGVEIPRDSLDPEGDFFAEVETDSITISPAAGRSNPLDSEVATAMVYGPSGSLAFYSDGKNVYDGNDEPVLDANGVGLLNGNNTASQGLTIIPKSSCNECPHHQYYVFSKDIDTGLLSYSVIDLRYNGGMGQIVERDVPVAAGITDKVTVLPKPDETGFDIFTHELGNNQIQIIGIDSVGIQTTETGIGIFQDEVDSNTGYTVFDEQGTQMAQSGVIGGDNVVEVLTYDPDTKAFSNPITINLGISAPPTVYGLSFSPDGNLLYATISGDPANGETSYLLQIPVFYTDPAIIQANILTIDESNTEQFGALQLGPINPNSSGEKFLYMAVKDSDKIAYLQAPDELGGPALVGYNDINRGIEVNGTVGLGFPSVTYANQEQEGGGASANYSGNCFNAATALEAQGICDPMRNEITWEFEDGTTMKGENVNYTFPKLGWNRIKVIIKVFNKSPLSGIINSQVIDKLLEATETECTQEVLVDSIYIKPSPVSALPDFAYVCTRDFPVIKAKLYAAVTGGDTFTYSWGTATGVPLGGNASDSIQEVIAPSVYTLEVENNFECSTSDEIEVLEGCEPRVFFPEAFSPIGPIAVNQSFKIEYAYLDEVNLKVFNRWGELVFETDNLDIKWDGRVKGKIQAPTLYPYVLTYKALDFPERGVLKEMGSVWVLK